METVKTLADAIDEISHSLRLMGRSGLEGFDCRQEALERMGRWGQSGGASGVLDGIQAEMGDCRRCGLAEGRTHIVFGDGDPAARLVFVGEGPGYDEDRQGKPFVGAAGRMLTNIIQAMGLTRDQVYICNIVKCRPPKNRNPEPGEISACRPFLRRQIEAIEPEFICALGSVAAKALLQTDQAISRLRGRFHDVGGVRVMPTYHPAYLLRNPDKKRAVWEDVQTLMKAMGKTL